MTSRSAKLTLPTDEQIRVVREFAAPRHLVWRAWTEPELIRRWWYAKRGRMTVAEVDLRVGGTYRYAMVTDGGVEVAFHGEYREIVADERLVATEVYEGDPTGGVAVTTARFTEHEGRTTVELTMEHGSKEVRDAVLATGMEDGLQDGLDLLEETAASLA
jgi:uncharacterized protein YndB with AHSA1/START domain